MPTTTDDPRISVINARRPLDDVLRFHAFEVRHRGPLVSPATSVKREARIYYLAGSAQDSGATVGKPLPLLRLWWQRRLERRRFARELPWIADEVLQDYGLTRDEARRLCRRPFWRA